MNRIVFSGYVPHAETPRYLSAFDVLVVPSRTGRNSSGVSLSRQLLAEIR